MQLFKGKLEKTDLDNRKNELLAKMAHLDRDNEDVTLRKEEWIDRACLPIELKDIAKYGLTWRQRSQLLRLKQGGGNTKFFPTIGNAHKIQSHWEITG